MQRDGGHIGRTGERAKPDRINAYHARGLEWDPFCGLHHGQRLNTPRKQAEYMTASNQVATAPHINDPGSHSTFN